jgi:hypothetical protein
MDGKERTEVQWVIERGAFKGGSLLVLSILSAVSVFSIYVIYRMMTEGSFQPIVLVLFVAFPVVATPLIYSEARNCLSARFEVSSEAVRYFVNGRLVEEMVLDPSVKADVRLDSSRIGPKPKAFDASCAEATLGPPEENFILLCGISLTKGDRGIKISHEDGWKLVDFSDIWDRFLAMVIEHDLEMGPDLWRYIDFRDSFQELGEDLEPDIFTRLREMEV